MTTIAPEIFKAYDIRGIVNQTLNTDSAKLIGKAIATLAHQQNIHTIAIGRDGRISGIALQAALSEGIRESGINILDIGMVATPMLYFAAHHHCQGSGVMITGSHNPPNYNGFKMMLGGKTLAGDTIQTLLTIIQNEQFCPCTEIAKQSNLDIFPAYRQYISESIKLQRPMNIVIDAGNGVAGAYAGELYRTLGCKVEELFCEVDGTFPNHHPDPAKPENLQDLIHALQEGKGEIGLAFDGDGDRLGVVTPSGQIIYPDRQLMLFAQHILAQKPNAKIIYDVKCTRLLKPWIEKHSGQAIMAKTGHSFMKAAIYEHQAELGGEMSGHIFFKDRWFGFDDGLYAGARLLEILAQSTDSTTTLEALPQAISTPEINIKLNEGQNGHTLIEQLIASATSNTFPNAQETITLDGLRVEFTDGFGLMRASNTTPVLVLRFEANNEAALERISQYFRTHIHTQTGLSW